jgi:SAM-dependent methyltransferase
MLAVAAARLSAAADHPARRLSLAEADALAPPVADSSVDFCLIGGNGSLGHLDDRQVSVTLQNVVRILGPGGGLGLDLVNPRLLTDVRPVRTFGPSRFPPPGVEVERTVSNRHDVEMGLVWIDQVTRFSAGVEQHEFRESFSLRLWRPDEIQAVLLAAGFKEVQLYGDHGGGPFDRWSSDLIVSASMAGS